MAKGVKGDHCQQRKASGILSKRPEFIIQLFVSCLFFLVITFFIRLDRIRTVFSQCNGYFLLGAVLLLPVIFLLRAYRWAWIINREERFFPIRDLFFLTLTGIALGFVTPGNLGEIGRSYFGTRAYGHREEMISSSVVDKLYGLFSLFLLAAITALPLSFFDYSILSLCLFFLLGIVLTAPNLFPWGKISQLSARFVKRRLDAARMAEGFKLPFRRKLIVTLISLLSWLGTCFLFFLICLSFQSNVSFSYVLAVVPLVILAGLFPLTLGGFGSHEAATVYLFHRVGIPGEVALLISLTFRLIFIVIPGVVGIYLVSLFKKREAET